jgi:hypothetical protein
VDSLLVITIPMALIVIGITLNGLHIVHDQPQFSLEENPTDKLAAERRANYHFFYLQRARMLKRQLSTAAIRACRWYAERRTHIGEK